MERHPGKGYGLVRRQSELSTPSSPREREPGRFLCRRCQARRLRPYITLGAIERRASAKSNAVLHRRIRTIWRRIGCDLRYAACSRQSNEQGTTVSRKRVARLMRRARIQRRQPPARLCRHDTARRRAAPCARPLPQLHRRCAKQAVVADMTHAHLGQASSTWPWCSTWSRRSGLGHRRDDDCRARACVKLNMALAPRAVVHHSDQGSQHGRHSSSASVAKRWASSLRWQRRRRRRQR